MGTFVIRKSYSFADKNFLSEISSDLESLIAKSDELYMNDPDTTIRVVEVYGENRYSAVYFPSTKTSLHKNYLNKSDIVYCLDLDEDPFRDVKQ